MPASIPISLPSNIKAVTKSHEISLSSLSSTLVPVPLVYCLCLDTNVIGTIFYIMQYIEGRIFHNPLLNELEPSDRLAIYYSMNQVLANLHQVNWKKIGLNHLIPNK